MDQEFRNALMGPLLKISQGCIQPIGQGGVLSQAHKVFCGFFFFFARGCRILATRPETEPVPSTVKAWSPNYWTTRLIPKLRRLLKGFKWQNSWGLSHNSFLYSINHIFFKPVTSRTERTHCSGLTRNCSMNGIWLWYIWYMVT